MKRGSFLLWTYILDWLPHIRSWDSIIHLPNWSMWGERNRLLLPKNYLHSHVLNIFAPRYYICISIFMKIIFMRKTGTILFAAIFCVISAANAQFSNTKWKGV